MLFNSFEFLFAFLPIVLLLYYGLHRLGGTTSSKAVLFLASLVFYGWYNAIYLPLLLGSIVFNFLVGNWLGKEPEVRKRKLILTLGIVSNVLLLMYFKYMNFFIDNVNYLTDSHISHLRILLPLGISFFTFQQIAYLTDSFKQLTKEYNLFTYSTFVTFFPHVISGPIVHHKDMMPQYNDPTKAEFDSFNFSKGLYIFFMGLVKKVVVADSFAVLANAGFGSAAHLGFLDSWITSISYSIQLYFDFSGYSDMALGIALLFNIHIAVNFNSPYKSVNIQDFWRRWHITLSSFLRDYIYIPLGGNRSGEYLTLQNLMVTFLVGGIWHGAAWTYIIWGAMHGGGLIVHRLWKKANLEMPDWLGLVLTLLYVNFAWVFFRAATLPDAWNMVRKMIGLEGFSLGPSIVLTDIYIIPMLVLGTVLLFFPNPPQLAQRFKTDYKHLAYITVLAVLGLLFMNSITANDFLYFDF